MERTLDAAFATAGVSPKPVDDLDWVAAARVTEIILTADARISVGALLEDREVNCGIGARARLERGGRVDRGRRQWALDVAAEWAERTRQALDRFDALVLPTLGGPPSDLPAIAVPLGGPTPTPVSLQIVGRDLAESTLMATARRYERILDGMMSRVC